jgi:hypothetical protein
MSDAAHAILTRPARECTGNFFIDETVLREAGRHGFLRVPVGWCDRGDAPAGLLPGLSGGRATRARRRLRYDDADFDILYPDPARR